MGLDIYLYKYNGDYDAIREAEAQFEERSEALYETEMTDDERAAARKAIAAEPAFAKYKLGDWGESDLKESISEPSVLFPDDICNIGYFRSSYNSSGMNSRLRDAVGKDLYWIFNNEDREDYHVIPDWNDALVRVTAVIDEVNALIEAYGNVEVMEFSPNMFADPSKLIGSVAEANAVYKEHYDKSKTESAGPFGNCGYSNSQGTFMINSPINGVKAIFAGYKKSLFGDDLQPCTYIVVESAADEGGLKWPLQSLAVVKETIEWVLAQDDPKPYVLHWSG